MRHSPHLCYAYIIILDEDYNDGRYRDVQATINMVNTFNSQSRFAHYLSINSMVEGRNIFHHYYIYNHNVCNYYMWCVL